MYKQGLCNLLQYIETDYLDMRATNVQYTAVNTRPYRFAEISPISIESQSDA